MKPEIVRNFVSNSIIRPGSEVLVSYVSESSFGLPSRLKSVFKVVRIIEAKGKYYFTLASIDDGQRSIVAAPEQIAEVDGMTYDRIIRAFNLTEEGTKKPRKPRKRKNKDNV
jgi:hypothetical protein